MTSLWWVRHGPTHAKAMVGWTDLPADLSDQAALARLDAYLPDGARVISSDLLRATTTADAVMGGRTRLPHDADLREIHFGDWEMQRFADVDARDPDRIRAFWDQPGDSRPPGGESWNDTSIRVSRATDRIIADHAGHDIIVVAHFGAILTQLQRALGVAAREVFAHKIDNLSVTRLDYDGSWHVRMINHIP